MSLDAPRRELLRGLERSGMLLLSDPVLPSVVALVAGEPVRGSWWGTPAGRRIYAAAEWLGEHDDVVVVKLADGKVTFVHRSLWADLLAVATERAAWQLDGLSAAAAALLEAVDAGREVRADRDRVPGVDGAQATAVAARALESRLLAHVRQVHTESGTHARVIESWRRWSARVGARAARRPERSRRALETAAERYAQGARAVRLPWQAGAARR